jgi:mannose-6-phosphate isomerase-like protein (cupin superfamily)
VTSAVSGSPAKFLFVVAGRATFTGDARSLELGPRDALAVPGSLRWALTDVADDLELLDVTMPGRVSPR